MSGEVEAWCDETVWDGPYAMSCSYAIIDGVCIRHGTGGKQRHLAAGEYGWTAPPVSLAPYQPTVIEIRSAAGVTLLTLREVDGRLDAEFDPAALTEAAQLFVTEIQRIWLR
jgi:hypothetical protein